MPSAVGPTWNQAVRRAVRMRCTIASAGMKPKSGEWVVVIESREGKHLAAGFAKRPEALGTALW